MRNLLAFLAAAVLVFAAGGWYMGWYKIQRVPATPGHRAVHIEINSDKIGQDLHKGAEKIQDVIDKHTQGSAGSTAPAK
jgi:hypothetical protein